MAPGSRGSSIDARVGSFRGSSVVGRIASLASVVDDPEEDVEALRRFLVKKEGSALKAWLKHFDVNNDQKISVTEFLRGMRRLDYEGDVTRIFSMLDEDNSQELSLDEVDPDQAGLWLQFRRWCVETFEGVQDMVRRLLTIPLAVRMQKGSRAFAPRDSAAAMEDRIYFQMFVDGLKVAGWIEGHEETLFNALDVDDQGYLTPPHLRWLEIEKRRQRRKDQAKKRATMENVKRGSNGQAAEAALADFKQFLKRKHGHYVRAWRNALSPDGSMILHKSDLFKACANIGWQGDVRLLYKACDKDDSGYISIEELDPRSGVLLARFRNFMVENFGDSSAAFRALDKHNAKKIRQQEFVSVLRSYGYNFPLKLLFHGLDVGGTKTLVEEDLLFLDRWKPPPFLIAQPSQQAAKEVKERLLNVFKNYLKAWRHVLDVDSSNQCNYDEFEAACKKIGYRGDVPGAWRALDEDLSGFITLGEIDPHSADILMNFRVWCDEEFGGVRSAFTVFDNSGDNEVSYREFRRSCRIYGYAGDVSGLFHALDVERSGSLGLHEVEFLDEWEITDKEGRQFDDVGGPLDTEDASFLPPKTAPESITDYCTEGPGPGAYSLPSSFGAGPLTPMVNFGGAYSFRKRPLSQQVPGLKRDAPALPAPTAYENMTGLKNVSPRKPHYSFGLEKRAANEPVAVDIAKPGPGNYSPAYKRGNSVTCTPRRPLRMHPLCRDSSILGGRGVGPLCLAQGPLPLTNG